MSKTLLLLPVLLVGCLTAFPQLKKTEEPHRISFSSPGITIGEIIDTIHKLTPYSVFPIKGVNNYPKKIPVNFDHATVEDILDTLKNMGLIEYFIKQGIYVVSLRLIGDISGVVIDSTKGRLPGASILIKGTNQSTFTNDSSRFIFHDVSLPVTLVVSHVSMEQKEVLIDSIYDQTIVMHPKDTLMNSVTVSLTVNDGYQEIPIEHFTGSFTMPRPDLVRNNPNPHIIGRLKDLQIQTPVGKRNNPLMQPMPLRGQNSFYGSKEVLIVIDNFPFLLNPEFISPNDIDTITIIRDAGAGAIYGSRGANGVVILKTKKGLKAGTELLVTSHYTIKSKPNVFYRRGLLAPDQVDLEKNLYNQQLINRSGVIDQPIRDALEMQRIGMISDEEAGKLINYYKGQDLLTHMNRYMYQVGINRQLSLSIRSGGADHSLYTGVSVDENTMNEKGDEFRRLNGLMNGSYHFGKFNLSVTTQLSNIKVKNNFIEIPTNLSYLPLVDPNGKHLPIPYLYSPSYIAANTQGYFEDWRFIPLDEAKIANNIVSKDLFSFGTSLDYTIMKGLRTDAMYQFAIMSQEHRNLHAPASFFVRDLVNRYRQLDQGRLSWPIPLAHILDLEKVSALVNNARLQLNYSLKKGSFEWNTLGGAEMRQQSMKMIARRIYGKNEWEPQTHIDFQTPFPISIAPNEKRRIPYIDERYDSLDYTESLFASTRFQLENKYTFSLSARKDFSNRISWHTSKNNMPFWSAALSWYVSKEAFYGSRFIPDLKFRMSYGVNGNIDPSTFPAASMFRTQYNGGLPVFSAGSPGNEDLGWEKLYMLNMGLDFSLKKHLISGSIDYYLKWGRDLLQYVLNNASSGNGLVKKNSGALNGYGIDMNLQSDNIPLLDGITLSGNLVLSYSKNKVMSDQKFALPATDYTSSLNSTFRKGYPVDALFAFRFAGLNPLDGTPIGYLYGVESQDYESMLKDTSLSGMIYVGPSLPVTFASLVLTLRYKKFSLSGCFNTRLGYYVRIPALNYSDLVNQHYAGTPEYYLRWQRPGDEKFTNVPGLQFPLNEKRDLYYALSTENIVRGDHVRLQYLQAGWFAERKPGSSFPVKRIDLNVTFGNPGIIWKSNRKGIDPDVAASEFPESRSVTFSLLVTI